MSAVVTPELPDLIETLDVPVERVSRLSVEQYHEMVRHGILRAGDPVELIDGLLVTKMGKNPPHVIALSHSRNTLEAQVGPGWHVRVQDPITLDRSEPEPDIAVARGAVEHYREAHPAAEQVGLVLEASDTTLADDQGYKLRLYARNRIPQYWIVNLVDDQVEVYTQPSGPGDQPEYGECRTFLPRESVPLVLDGQVVAHVPVESLLP
jgi:Uma2 family endonuclease